MIGLNPSILMQSQPFQLPDPIAQYASALKLSDLARQNRLGAADEEKLRRTTQLESDFQQVLPLLLRGDRAGVESAMQANPSLVAPVMNFLGQQAEGQRKQETHAAALGKTRADTGKAVADTDKISLDTKLAAAKQIGGYAQSLLSRAQAGEEIKPDELKMVGDWLFSYKIDAGKLPNPMQQPIEFLKGAVGFGMSADQQLAAADRAATRAETGRSNLANEASRAATLKQGMTIAQMNDARAREGHALTRRGQDMGAGDAGKWVNDFERGIQVNTGTGETRPMLSGGAPIGPKKDMKQAQMSTRAGEVVNLAEPLIKNATGSYAGAAMDQAMRIIGQSTEGAQSIAKLKALEGALMMNQPRMEGPQSDKDVAVYRQMAGRIGDATVPNSEKMAALETIKELHEKYSETMAGGAKQSSGSSPAPKSDVLPSPSSLPNGTRVVDDATGEVLIVKNGKYVKER